MSWYTFNVFPVGPGLPPADPVRGITPDMCIAIYPNESHPTGRPPLHPTPGFPYTNCYHWIDTSMDVRVCARPNGFDVDDAIILPVEDEIDMQEFWGIDHDKIWSARNAPNGDGPDPSRAQAQHLVPVTEAKPEASEKHSQGDESYCVARPDIVGDDTVSIHSGSGSSFGTSTTSDSASSGDSDPGMLFFGNTKKNMEGLPLVHLWLDVAHRLKEEEIASPVDLFAECDAIKR